MGAYSGNVYLATPTERYKYMRIPIKLIPKNFIDKYNITSKVKRGMFIVKLFAECTNYPRQKNLPMTSSSSGITTKDMLTFQCQTTSPKNSQNMTITSAESEKSVH